MTANIKVIRSDAETALLDQFRAAKASLPGAASARQDAIDLFSRLGLPHRRVESWHYTDLRAALRTAAPIEANKLHADDLPARDALTDGVRLVLIDGVFRADLSDMDALPSGVAVRSLAEALSAGDASFAEFAPDFVGRGDSVVALNTALMRDGIVIDVAANAVVEKTIVLLSLISPGASHASFSRSVLRVGDKARVRLVECCETVGEGAAQSNESLVVTLGEGAHVQHIARVRYAGSASIHLHSLALTQGGKSRFDSFCLIADGGLARRQVFAAMAGEHATLNLSGLSLLDGARLADTTLVVDHAVPHGTSREFFRYILDGESTGVYQGKVIVRPHAQKTDGGMKSNALVLSDTASMNNKPELEIFADDVVCGHGATVGQLDDDMLFYLMARCLPKAEAEALLVEAFAGAVVETVEDEALRDALMDDVRAWLARRNGGAHA